MKKTYMKPEVAVVAMQDLCDTNGLMVASVQTSSGDHVDSFDVVEQDQEAGIDWDDKSTWGGN